MLATLILYKLVIALITVGVKLKLAMVKKFGPIVLGGSVLATVVAAGIVVMCANIKYLI